MTLANVAALMGGPSPLLGSLVGGFVLLVTGLAVLTVGPRRNAMSSPASTRRAIAYALIFGLCSACFSRLLQGALMGHERNPLLLAVGDVIFVTLVLFVWVMVLAEGHSLSAYGFRPVRGGQFVLMVGMALGPVAVYSLGSYRYLVVHPTQINADTLVFALMFAGLGSAVVEEMIFRGYLMGSLEGRVSQWARVALPAIAFTIVRAVRFLPGPDLGWTQWLGYIFGVALPLGLWWGLMRELGAGAIWGCLLSHFLLELGPTLAGQPPALPG